MSSFDSPYDDLLRRQAEEKDKAKEKKEGSQEEDANSQGDLFGNNKTITHVSYPTASSNNSYIVTHNGITFTYDSSTGQWIVL